MLDNIQRPVTSASGLSMGELEPLPIPEHRWDTISVDFIIELPEAHEYDVVMNVVDSVSKQAHFVSTNTMVTALGMARLYLAHVWNCMSFQSTLCLTEDPNLLLNSPMSSTDSLEPSLWQPLPITCKVTTRPSESTRNWNSTYTCLSMNIRTTGMASYHWPSSSTPTMSMLRCNRPLS